VSSTGASARHDRAFPRHQRRRFQDVATVSMDGPPIAVTGPALASPKHEAESVNSATLGLFVLHVTSSMGQAAMRCS